MARTRIDEELAAAERAHADDPDRADVLARARRFKSSWLELGEALSEVRRNGKWKRWGHESFDDYARKELHLKQDTAEKLTASYAFLERRAPAVLERNGLDQPIPSYQSIDFLRRAEEQENAPAELVAELRRRVIDDAAPLPALSRKYREVIFPLDDGIKKTKDSGGALRSTARRLVELLDGDSQLPARVVKDVRGALDQLLDALDIG